MLHERRERGFAVPDRYDEFEPQVRRLEAAMRRAPEALVPCNNDLLAENFLWDGTRFRLIDWEYSGMNEASFEVGNVWSESDLSLDQLEQLVGAYWGAATPAKVARARMWGLMSKYGWTLWGVIQQMIFQGLAHRRLLQLTSRAPALIAASLLFASVHLADLRLAGLTLVAGLA